MFRGAVIALLSILCLGLTITAALSWRAQSQLSGEVRSLTEQLKLLAEKQAAAPAVAPAVVAAAEPKPLVIEGRIYDGAPTRPLADRSVIVLDVKDGREVRTIKTNANGEFVSGPLAGGDYSIVAQGPGQVVNGRSLGRFAQSVPISAYPGVPVPKRDFDVSMHLGALRIETSRPLPKRVVGERYVIDTRLLVSTISRRERSGLWTVELGGSNEWPLFASMSRVNTGNVSFASERRYLDLLTRERVSSRMQGTSLEKARFPAGKISVKAALLVDLWPVDYQPQDQKQQRFYTGSSFPESNSLSAEWQSAERGLTSGTGALFSLVRSNRTSQSKLTLENDDYWWMTKGLGQIWLRRLREQPLLDPVQPFVLSLDDLQQQAKTGQIPIEDGRVTRLRVEIPPDLEDRIQQLVENTTTPDDFAKLAFGVAPEEGSRGRRGFNPSPPPRNESPFLQPAILTVAGTDPLLVPAAEMHP